MARVRKRKELMWTEVAKKELVDRWWGDNIKPERWDHIDTEDRLHSTFGPLTKTYPTLWTLLPFVVENHPLDIFEQLFHDRTSFQVKSFTL